MPKYILGLLVSALGLMIAPAHSQTTGLAAGAKVFVAPMDGFERYIQSAILSKKLPLVVVADNDKADYIIGGTWRELDGGFSGNGSLVRPLRTRKNYSASISITDQKTRTVLHSIAVEKSGSRDLSKEIAEEWATKLLKELRQKR